MIKSHALYQTELRRLTKRSLKQLHLFLLSTCSGQSPAGRVLGAIIMRAIAAVDQNCSHTEPFKHLSTYEYEELGTKKVSREGFEPPLRDELKKSNPLNHLRFCVFEN